MLLSAKSMRFHLSSKYSATHFQNADVNGFHPGRNATADLVKKNFQMPKEHEGFFGNATRIS